MHFFPIHLPSQMKIFIFMCTYHFHCNNFCFCDMFNCYTFAVSSSNPGVHCSESSFAENFPNFIQFVKFPCGCSSRRGSLHCASSKVTAVGVFNLDRLAGKFNFLIVLRTHGDAPVSVSVAHLFSLKVHGDNIWVCPVLPPSVRGLSYPSDQASSLVLSRVRAWAKHYARLCSTVQCLYCTVHTRSPGVQYTAVSPSLAGIRRSRSMFSPQSVLTFFGILVLTTLLAKDTGSKKSLSKRIYCQQKHPPRDSFWLL